MPGAPRILLQMNSIFRVRFAWGLVAAVVAGLLLYLISPILSPFLFAGILAYICLPLVDRLAKRMPRWLAASIVLVLLLLGLSLLVLIVAPMVERQFAAFLQKVPDYVDWVRERFLPWLSSNTGVEVHLNLDHVKHALADSLRADNDVLKALLPKLTTGGAAIIGFFTAVLLVPVMLFYFLRDWREFMRRIEDLIPRRSHLWAVSFAGEINRVLGEFLRGQIAVILIMCVYYVLGLWIAGLEYSLPIGILSGLLVFVPYLGALVGLLLATLAGISQFDSILGLVGVWAVFGIGQLLEGFMVTPWLAGNRIGLHPVAVIFALLMFGHLFGFFGVLLALPASAALLVGLRHLREHYLASDLYKS
jgi:predicted PurR-regulated permease PerM